VGETPGVRILPVGDPEWTAFVGACQDATPFHHPTWSSVLSECYGYRALALGLTDGRDRIVAGVPVLDAGGPFGRRRWVALPFTDFCPVLTGGRPVEGLAPALLRAAQAQRLGAFELHADLSGEGGFHRTTSAVRHTQALPADASQLYRGLSTMHQRNLRKAERAGMEIRLGQQTADMERFYALHLLTRRRLGVPIQPRRFFRLLAERMLARGLGFTLSAHLQGTTIAAAVFLHWNGVLVYKFGASDPRYWSHRPNNLLLWSALRWGCENGYHTFDWGRTDLEDEGLRAFKRGWGAREQPLTYAVAAPDPPRPSFRVRRLLKHVIRGSPPWVCQAVGELLYRYAA
jgi:CelD/BcsL family acetyltransferase involved in cellulose biosynthesis